MRLILLPMSKILEQKKLIEDGDKLGMVIDFDGVFKRQLFIKSCLGEYNSKYIN